MCDGKLVRDSNIDFVLFETITSNSFDKEIDDIVAASLRLRISERKDLDDMRLRYYELENAVAGDGRGYGGPSYEGINTSSWNPSLAPHQQRAQNVKRNHSSSTE